MCSSLMILNFFYKSWMVGSGFVIKHIDWKDPFCLVSMVHVAAGGVMVGGSFLGNFGYLSTN